MLRCSRSFRGYVNALGTPLQVGRRNAYFAHELSFSFLCAFVFVVFVGVCSVSLCCVGVCSVSLCSVPDNNGGFSQNQALRAFTLPAIGRMQRRNSKLDLAVDQEDYTRVQS